MGLGEFEEAYGNIQNLNVDYNPPGMKSVDNVPKKTQSLPVSKIQAAPEKSKFVAPSNQNIAGPSKLDPKNTANIQRQLVKDLQVLPVSIKIPFSFWISTQIFYIYIKFRVFCQIC